MIEVKMPKNILVYKTKLLGPLNLKQTICFALALALDFIVYQLVVLNFQLPREAVFYLFILLDIPILIFGYYEPMGMPLEKYLKYYMQSVFMAPKYRKNKRVLYKAETSRKKKVKKSKNYRAYK